MVTQLLVTSKSLHCFHCDLVEGLTFHICENLRLTVKLQIAHSSHAGASSSAKENFALLLSYFAS